jgi:hypothetical protein
MALRKTAVLVAGSSLGTLGIVALVSLCSAPTSNRKAGAPSFAGPGFSRPMEVRRARTERSLRTTSPAAANPDFDTDEDDSQKGEAWDPRAAGGEALARARAAVSLQALHQMAQLRAAMGAAAAAAAIRGARGGGWGGGARLPADNWSGPNDNFWSSRFSSGNSNADNSQGYVHVPDVGAVGYGF